MKRQFRSKSINFLTRPTQLSDDSVPSPLPGKVSPASKVGEGVENGPQKLGVRRLFCRPAPGELSNGPPQQPPRSLRISRTRIVNGRNQSSQAVNPKPTTLIVVNYLKINALHIIRQNNFSLTPRPRQAILTAC
jgi:hypothetical protein